MLENNNNKKERQKKLQKKNLKTEMNPFTCIYNARLHKQGSESQLFRGIQPAEGRALHKGIPNCSITLLSSCNLLHILLAYLFFLNSKSHPQWEERLCVRYTNHPSEISPFRFLSSLLNKYNGTDGHSDKTRQGFLVRSKVTHQWWLGSSSTLHIAVEMAIV